MKSLLVYLVRELVDNPDAVNITEVEHGDSTTFEVRVGPNDLGKVIGRHGRNAQALRLVAKAMTGKDPRRVFVEMID